ncbi:uncharacterized protein [Procambarus clarkii]|uniref:uncharacterized protein n=1 Tax=Procambarus clarkii TaxID=6728 RepID=UPI001E66FF66|nr:uncharacterized protein LOC123762537 [Procambarus clarkii]
MAAATLGGVTAKHRDKRYIYINPDVNMRLGFLINLPVSLAIPTLAPVNGRSFDLSNTIQSEVFPEDLAWEPAYEQALSRLTTYFAHLELPTLSCQERFICEVTADPESLFPISQIFMKELKLLNGPVDTTERSLMWRYMMAAREGFTAPVDKCALSFPSCPLSAQRVLNMPVLRVWQYVFPKLDIKPL